MFEVGDLACDETMPLEEGGDVGTRLTGELPRVAGQKLPQELQLCFRQRVGRYRVSVGEGCRNRCEALLPAAPPELPAH